MVTIKSFQRAADSRGRFQLSLDFRVEGIPFFQGLRQIQLTLPSVYCQYAIKIWEPDLFVRVAQIDPENLPGDLFQIFNIDPPLGGSRFGRGKIVNLTGIDPFFSFSNFPNEFVQFRTKNRGFGRGQFVPAVLKEFFDGRHPFH